MTATARSYSTTMYDNREAWLDARRQGLGASDAPVVLGLVKRSPLALFHEKHGVEAAEDELWRIRMLEMGLLMEPVIAGLFEREMPAGLTLMRPPSPFHIERSKEHPWLTATTDRMAIQDGERPAVVELKNVSVWASDTWLEDGAVPLNYEVQVQHQLAVTGFDVGYIAAVIGGVDFKWARIERNQEFIDLLIRQEQQFWEAVERGEPPAVDGLEDTKRILAQLYPRKAAARSVELPVRFLELDDERELVVADIKSLERKKDAIENEVRAYLNQEQAQEGLLRSGARYTWKMQHRDGFTVAPTDFPVLRRSAPRKGK